MPKYLGDDIVFGEEEDYEQLKSYGVPIDYYVGELIGFIHPSIYFESTGWKEAICHNYEIRWVVMPIGIMYFIINTDERRACNISEFKDLYDRLYEVGSSRRYYQSYDYDFDIDEITGVCAEYVAGTKIGRDALFIHTKAVLTSLEVIEKRPKFLENGEPLRLLALIFKILKKIKEYKED